MKAKDHVEGSSKPNSYVATIEVEIEIEVSDGFIDIVTIMTALTDHSERLARLKMLGRRDSSAQIKLRIPLILLPPKRLTRKLISRAFNQVVQL